MVPARIRHDVDNADEAGSTFQFVVIKTDTLDLPLFAQIRIKAAKEICQSLLSLMDDCAALVETPMQWMSASPTARQIDRELGDLRHDRLALMPLLSYLRYNLDLSADAVLHLMPSLTDPKKIESLTEMDEPDNMEVLQQLGALAAQQQVRVEDFAANFDLPI